MDIVASVIIPAHNEERFIGRVLAALAVLADKMPIEVIVVDNGSSDATRDMAEAAGVCVIDCPTASVAAVRNAGAARAEGAALIFLDADVEITSAYRDALPDVLHSLKEDPLQVRGARCHAADDIGLLNRHWFNRLRDYEASYINSGNLLTSRVLFDAIEGFDGALATAEDHDFCARARAAGGRIVETPELVTLHLGYPETIRAFLRRERWHGKQDFATLADLRASKVAWLATLNLAVLSVCVILGITLRDMHFLLVYPLFLAALSVALTVHRFGINTPLRLFATSSVFALYLWGRSLAGLDRLLRSWSPR